MNAEKNKKLKTTIYYCGMAFLALMGILFLYWKSELEDRDRPIAHRTEVLTNEFELTVGEIRGINIKRKHTLQNVDLHLVIEDKNGNEIWQNWYENLDIADEYREIEHFYPENLIDVPKGKYIAKFYLDDQEDSEIRGEFVEYRAGYSKYFMGFSILAVGLILFSIVMLRCDKLELFKLYFILAVFTGIFYSFIFPALSMPDEHTHFGEAYRMAGAILGQPIYDENHQMLLRADDYDNFTYRHNIDTLSEWYESTIQGSRTELVVADYDYEITTIWAKYAYAVPAFGIALARLMNLPGRVLLSMGRLFNLVFCAGIIALAIYLTPRFKLFMCVIGLLPETILLMNSYSYDALNVAMSILVAAYFLYLCDKETIRYREIFLFLGLLLLFIPIKVVYLPFALLLFLLPSNNGKAKFKGTWVILGSVIISIIILGILNLSQILSLISRSNNGQDSESMIINVSYVFSNVTDIAKMYIRTLIENTFYYFQSMIGEIYSVGRFGNNIGYAAPAWLCIIVSVVFLVSLFGEEDNNICKSKKRDIITIIIMAGSALAAATSMLFGCTRTNCLKIEGIQGRYFLPLLSLLPLFIKTKRIHFTISSEQLENRCLFLMQAVNLSFAWATMHYYTSMYFNI